MSKVMGRTTKGLAALAVLTLLPAAVWAQSGTTGAIAGVVRDTTGGVLPGVTVEAASPALIEKVRTAVTDEQGQYKIVDLRPGPYTVTFNLPGFSTVRREGLELNTGFTATVNAELRVGALEETVTVSGASPVVDIQNVRSQNVLTREVLDSVPTSKNYQAYAGLTLGAMGLTSGSVGGGDVGGSKGEQMTGLWIHGAARGLTTVDGMRITTATNFYDNHRYFFNQLGVQEIVLETGGAGAESLSGSLNVNMVPKDGGNTFSGSFATEYANRDLQGSNLSDALRARGLSNTNTVRTIYDVGVGVGGPIRRDRLWFYTAHRGWGSEEELAGVYFNKLQGTLFYEPDRSRPGYYDNYVRDNNLRLTWQATPKQKVTLSGGLQDYCRCYSFLGGTGGSPVPESTYDYRMFPNNLFQANWTNAVSTRLLIEAGWTLRVEHHVVQKPEETGNARSVSELATGLAYGSLFGGSTTSRSDYGDHGGQGQWSTRFAVSYITGSHAFKAGLTTFTGESTIAGNPVYNVQYIFRNRVPVGLNQVAFPHHHVSRVKMDLGIFVQDQWTIDKLTLNLGVRVDDLNSYNPAQTRPAGEFLPAIDFPALKDVPNWRDISPRLGAAYDVFGNGKTALKVAVGRYVRPETTDITNRTNPAGAIAALTSRTWNDTNGDYVPDCDLKDRAPNGECGRMANQRFGTPVVQTRYAKDVTEGWHVRPFHWSASAMLQHELRPGVGLTLGYFRTWWGNFNLTDNLAVTPEDFDSYCITAPRDARLPRDGGYQVCGLYDVKPAKFGLVDNLVTQASNFGTRKEIYNGIEGSISARFGRGGVLSGGVSFGHTRFDNCAAPDTPPQFCRSTFPFEGQTQIKFSGAYPLPWDLQASASLQNLSGIPTVVTYAATNAEIAPALGRNLASCGATVPCVASAIVTIVEPNTAFEDRYTLLDVRLSKVVRVGRLRVQPRVDVYNLLNSGAVLSEQTRYGPIWHQPRELFGARFVKVGAQVDF